jgi:hypothetical protein
MAAFGHLIKHDLFGKTASTPDYVRGMLFGSCLSTPNHIEGAAAAAMGAHAQTARKPSAGTLLDLDQRPRCICPVNVSAAGLVRLVPTS